MTFAATAPENPLEIILRQAQDDFSLDTDKDSGDGSPRCEQLWDICGFSCFRADSPSPPDPLSQSQERGKSIVYVPHP
jgi:hypothetical protein